MPYLCDLCFIFSFIFIVINHIQGQRHGRGGVGGPCPPSPQKENGKPKRKITIFKAETIERLSPRSKCHCFSHSRVSRIQKIFLSATMAGCVQCISVPWPLHFEIHYTSPNITSFKQTYLFFVHILKYLLLFLDDNVDEKSQ